MITPITSEEEWLQTLQGASLWSPPDKPTIIISPHPDDETLATGGLIARQRRRAVPVEVVAVTDGDAAYPDQDLAVRRRAEQEQALQILGVDASSITRLGLPDSKVSQQEEQLAESLAAMIPADSLVVAPWSLDWHPDHEACGRAAEIACAAKRAELVSFLFWTWHAKTPGALPSLGVRRFEVDPALQHLKQEALKEHRSQLEREGGDPILPLRLLAPARRSYEVYICGE